jgi:hypothetical protein
LVGNLQSVVLREQADEPIAAGRRRRHWPFVVDQTQALHALKSQGSDIHAADLAFLSPYATSKLKRFGDYPTQLNPEPLPTRTTLPPS